MPQNEKQAESPEHVDLHSGTLRWSLLIVHKLLWGHCYSR